MYPDQGRFGPPVAPAAARRLVIIVATVALPLWPEAALGSGPIFNAAFERLQFPSSCQTAAVADLNGDGRLDLVTADASGQILVFPGDPDGWFQPAVGSQAGGQVLSFALGDIDGDGRLDAVTTDWHTDVVHVLRGNGDATFSTLSALSVPLGGPHNYGSNNSRVLALVDLDRDGREDLVVARPDSGLIICLGNGDGSFRAPTAIAQRASNAPAFCVDDFDLDGLPDIAITVQDAPGRLLLNDGGGRFHDAGPFDAGTNLVGGVPYCLAVADMNRDGLPDLVAGWSPYISVMIGNGDGTFRAPCLAWLGPYPPNHWPCSIAIGDFNGDGIPDVAYADDGYPRSPGAVLFGNGDGTLRGPRFFTGLPGSLTAADLNRDGKLDLVGPAASVALGNGDGTFGLNTEVDVSGYPAGIALADFDRDGRLDIAVAREYVDSLTVLFGTGDGNFARRLNLAAPQGMKFVGAGDFNGDGWPDLAAASPGSPPRVLPARPGAGPLIYLSDGAGGFLPPVAVAHVPSGATALRVADLNRDGNADLLFATATAGDSLMEMMGGPLFLDSQRLLLTTVGALISIEVGDLNRDGRIDLAIGADSGSNTFDAPVFLLGDGSGGFGSPQLGWRNPGIAVTWNGVGDFNGDGVSDDAAIRGGAVIDEHLGPALQMPPAEEFGTGWTLWPAAVADFDGDGTDDIAVYVQAEPVVLIFLGAPGAGLQPHVDFRLPSTLAGADQTVVASDVNGDGMPDLLLSEASGRVCVMLNRSSPRAVPVLVSIVDAVVQGSDVVLDWYSAGARNLTGLVERSFDHGVWVKLASVATDGTGHLRYRDSGVSPGEYRYRLSIELPSSDAGTTGEVAVLVPGQSQFELESVHPNPTTGLSKVTISLSDAGPATLEVVDVSGRLVARHPVGALGPGRHEFLLPGQTALGEGIYLVRLRQGSRSVSRRFVVLR